MLEVTNGQENADLEFCTSRQNFSQALILGAFPPPPPKKKIVFQQKIEKPFKGLFTWREGAPANQATQLTDLPGES